MLNQDTSFPFDALDVPEDFGASDLYPASFSTTAGDQSASLQAIRRKLQELENELRLLLSIIDRELARVSAVSRSSSFSPSTVDYESVPDMTTTRPIEPLSSGLQSEDGTALRVIEGVFDGQNMVGPDGKHYSVPANYASKSKLVEGDIMKLTITPRGAFVYKQIGPIARDRRIGILECDDVTKEFVVIVPDNEEDRSVVARAVLEHHDLPTVPYKRHRVLRSSVTFFRGSPADEAVVLVPKGAPSTWAAVENVIKR